ncbi:MAG: hypothetical protein GKR95_22240 [Gammaproteobacteria bacterium]|nr:hypothetical protein [Gammaproteobacteria bacterium]
MNKFPLFYVARVQVETKSPLSIATGQSSEFFDTGLVCDANGLPAIPGTSIAGVLRHLYFDVYGEEVEQVFGFQKDHVREHDFRGQVSRANFSWGCMHDRNGVAIQGLYHDDTELRADTLLGVALELSQTPEFRDRVAIDHQGVSANKFNRSVLLTGYRFTFEITYWSDNDQDKKWSRLLSLLYHPLFRIGGNTRSGLGKLEIVEIRNRGFDLREGQGRRDFVSFSKNRNLNESGGFSEFQNSELNTDHITTVELELEPRSFWRIGQGDHNTLTTSDGRPARLLPKLEQVVSWEKGIARPAGRHLLIPASSVKGAIAYRVAFYANCIEKQWADNYPNNEMKQSSAKNPQPNDISPNDMSLYNKSEQCNAVRELFGFVAEEEKGIKTRSIKRMKDERLESEQSDTVLEGNLRVNTPENARKSSGRVGKVLIDDGYLSFGEDDLMIIMHNSIDRFTGNARAHMLFSEELVWGKPINP